MNQRSITSSVTLHSKCHKSIRNIARTRWRLFRRTESCMVSIPHELIPGSSNTCYQEGNPSVSNTIILSTSMIRRQQQVQHNYNICWNESPFLILTSFFVLLQLQHSFRDMVSSRDFLCSLIPDSDDPPLLIDMVPGSEMTRANWWEIWTAGVAVYVRCIQNLGARGAAINLGKLTFSKDKLRFS